MYDLSADIRSYEDGGSDGRWLGQHDCPNNENEECTICLRLGHSRFIAFCTIWTMAENEPNEYEGGGSPSLLW